MISIHKYFLLLGLAVCSGAVACSESTSQGGNKLGAKEDSTSTGKDSTVAGESESTTATAIDTAEYNQKVKEMWEAEQEQRIKSAEKNWQEFQTKRPEHKG